MTIPDGNILTSLLKDFTSITASSRPLIQGYAVKVLVSLMTIDIIILGIYWMLDSQEHTITQQVVKKSLKYGTFVFMVLFFKDIVNAFSASFIQIGLEAAGKTLSTNDFTNPSYISTLGMDMVGPFLQNIIDGKSVAGNNGTIVDVVKSIPSSLLLGLVYLMIMACFFLIAINIFVLYIEFAVFTSVALILVPFGVWEHTNFIFEKAKNGVINYGIKYMTLAFIVSITMNKIKDWQLPPDPTFQQALYVLLGMMALTYLSWHAPTVAAGFAGGSGGTMSGAAVGGFVGGAAGGVAGTGGGIASTVVGGKNPITGQRSGLLPAIGRMTGISPRAAQMAAAMPDAAKTGAGKTADAIKTGTSKVWNAMQNDPAHDPPPLSPSGSSTTRMPSGVDLQKGPTDIT